MDILVQYPSQTRGEAVHHYEHGHLWIEDELIPVVIGSNLVAEIEKKLRDALEESESKSAQAKEDSKALNLETEYKQTNENSINAEKIVSAMKGSREKQGIHIESHVLSVKWAPDVYDPPITIRIRSRHHHSKLRKKSHSHKLKAKGKTSRSSSSSHGKKHNHL